MKITFNAETIPGTRNYHRFIPISNNIIGCKIMNHHEKNAIVFNWTEKIAYSWSTNTYVTFALGNAWHLGFISQTSEELLEAQISTLNLVAKNNYMFSDPKLNIAYSHILSEVIVVEKIQFIVIKLLKQTKNNFDKYLKRN